ncbi:MAG: hypothetical protein MJ239_05275 [Bacilli bacterium]|nr:hypothetical protein [Bacilli bacterium]
MKKERKKALDRLSFLGVRDDKSRVYASLIASFIFDVIVMVVYFSKNFDPRFGTFMIVAVLIDVAYFVIVHYSSLRFRYSLVQALGYAITSLAFALIPLFVFYNPFGKTLVFTTSMILASLACHLISAGTLVYVSFLSRVITRKYEKTSYLMTALSIVSLGVLGYYVCVAGFFGQNNSRTVVYEKNGNGYKAVDVIAGGGSTVEIDKFNDKTVSEIDCSIFERDDIAEIKVYHPVTLVNKDALLLANPNLKIVGDFETIDSISTQIIDTCVQNIANDNVRGLYNHLDYGMEKETKTISFAYSKKAFDVLVSSKVNYSFVPMQAADSFKGSETYKKNFVDNPYGNKLFYTEDDLISSFQTNGKKILLLDEKFDNWLLDDQSPSEAHCVFNVDVADLYHVKFEKSNDDLYLTSKDVTTMKSKTFDGRIVMKEPSKKNSNFYDVLFKQYDFDNVLNEFDSYIKGREECFSFSWKAANAENKIVSFEKLDEVNFKNNVASIYPTWTLEAPELIFGEIKDGVKKEGKTFDHVYGDRVEMFVDVKNEYDCLDYAYSWEFKDKTTTEDDISGADSDVCTVASIDRGTGSRTPTAAVTVSSLQTSLTAEASTANFTLNVSKKTVGYSLFFAEDQFAESLTYDGNQHPIAFAFNKSELVRGDSLDSCVILGVTSGGVFVTDPVNAGTYKAALTLTNATGLGNCYEIRLASRDEFVINKAEAHPLWPNYESDHFVYNAQAQGIGTVSFEDVFGNTVNVTLTSKDEFKKAGDHVFTASLPTSYEKNYFIPQAEASRTYSIAKYTIDGDLVVGSSDYGDPIVSPSVSWRIAPFNADVEGLVTYQGTPNRYDGAGDYSVSFSVKNDNYALASSSRLSGTYVIEKKEVTTINWEEMNGVIYDGKDHFNQRASFVGVQGEKEELVIATIEMKDAGSYALNANLSTEQSKNYVFSASAEISHTYVISKKNVSLVWTDQSFTYCGTEQTVVSPKFTDVFGNSVPVDVDCDDAFVDAGFHNFTAHLPSEYEKNYVLTGTLTHAYEISKKQVSAEWSDRTYTYSGYLQFIDSPTFVDVFGNRIELEADSYTILDAGAYSFEVYLPAEHQSNYSLTNTTHSYTVAKKVVTANWANQTFTYNGEVQSIATPTFKDAYGDDYNLEYNQLTMKNAGSYTYTATLPSEYRSNYTLMESSATKTYTIMRAKVTLVAANKESYEGENPAALTYEVASGTLFGDDANSVSLSCVVTSTTTAGTYNIEISFANANYDVTLENGTYTVKPVVVPSEAMNVIVMANEERRVAI